MDLVKLIMLDLRIFTELFDDRVFKKAVKHNINLDSIIFLTVPIASRFNWVPTYLTGIKKISTYYIDYFSSFLTC